METLVAALGSLTPDVAEGAFLARGATVLGDVHIHDAASVWYGTVLRAESAPITVGQQSNLQDGCVVHTDAGFPATIGDRVSVGHRSVLHGCTVSDDVLVGMSATLLNGARIGSWSLVAAGAVVREGFEVPAGVLVAGVPARIVRELTDAERTRIANNAAAYVHLAGVHRDVAG